MLFLLQLDSNCLSMRYFCFISNILGTAISVCDHVYTCCLSSCTWTLCFLVLNVILVIPGHFHLAHLSWSCQAPVAVPGTEVQAHPGAAGSFPGRPGSPVLPTAPTVAGPVLLQTLGMAAPLTPVWPFPAFTPSLLPVLQSL